MPVAVVMPYAGSGCVWRERARHRIRAHYATEHPDWPVVEGTCSGTWSKGAAVADALTRTDADTLVIADADLWVAPEALREAVGALGTHRWAIPHGKVHRLDERATTAFYGDVWRPSYDRPAYRGVRGGGLAVLGRETYEDCPIDPRFLGWGGEDVSWGWALLVKHGPPWRGDAALWHLWHPSVQVGHVGGADAEALVRRYKKASRRPGGGLDELLDEAREALCVASP